jgi:hypothetical protein
MRKLLLLPLLLWACGGDKAPKTDDAAMAAPAALTAADVVGSYAGATTIEGTDSVSNWTSTSTTNATGELVGELVQAAAPDMAIPMVATLSADSVIWVGGPYTAIGAAADAPQMMWTAVGRATGNAWTGTVVWMTAGSDSVMQRGTWTATRTP